jgi:hypothetical protein
MSEEITYFVTEKNDFLLIKTNGQGLIPEFSSWTILPFLVTITFVIILFKSILNK